MNKANSQEEQTPAQRITYHIEQLADWRGPMLARLRKLIHAAAPDIIEEWSRPGPVPVQPHGAGLLLNNQRP